MATLALALTAAAAIGYTLGRIRPWNRLADWADWQIRIHPGRWIGRGRHREALLFVALLATQPRRLMRCYIPTKRTKRP